MQFNPTKHTHSPKIVVWIASLRQKTLSCEVDWCEWSNNNKICHGIHHCVHLRYSASDELHNLISPEIKTFSVECRKYTPHVPLKIKNNRWYQAWMLLTIISNNIFGLDVLKNSFKTKYASKNMKLFCEIGLAIIKGSGHTIRVYTSKQG